ncbi:MAG: hypothetical protein ACXVPY_09450 [Bacteroidia bacterium]
MKHFKYILVLTVICVSLFSACIKEKSFPPQPVIEFKQYVSHGQDSADCIISFKDGDGDVGILSSDTISPNDFKMKYLYKDTDGVFKPFDAIDTTAVMDTLFYSYRVPNLTPDGQYKALDGEIKAKLRAVPIYMPGHHIVKFEITLRDRAGHLSNKVTTNDITVP